MLRTLSSVLHNETASGILLIVCAAAAVLLATLPGGGWFDRFWENEIGLQFGDLSFGMSLRLWINDALMAIFFLVVGLDIKREMLEGHLHSLKRSILPVAAAFGGMLVPALIYTAFNHGNPETAGGWGIPMATDIAFAIGILSLLDKRVPPGIKVFLTALAIVDDLGAIIVLAIFYPTHAIHFDWLIYAGLIMLMLVMFNRAKIRRISMYVIPGLALWYCMYRSGIHATISGVLLAITIPARRSGTRDADSPLHTLKNSLGPAVYFIIMPLFALANANVALNFDAFASGIPDVSLGIFFGLLLGKPAGIFLFSLASIKCRLAEKPEGTSWAQLFAAGILGGIGFTMSIFIDNLAFDSKDLADIGKISILLTSSIAAVLGLIVLRLTGSRKRSPFQKMDKACPGIK